MTGKRFSEWGKGPSSSFNKKTGEEIDLLKKKRAKKEKSA